MPRYEVGYRIVSRMDSPPSTVTEDTVVVLAANKKEARSTAKDKIMDEDHHYDDRIDPGVRIDHVTELDELDEGTPCPPCPPCADGEHAGDENTPGRCDCCGAPVSISV